MADGKFPVHPLVGKLGDTAAVKLMGYFGSAGDGVVKIHPSLDDLATYYEVREDDIVHVEDAPADVLPYGGSAIWVKADASVQHHVSASTTVQARYLAGGIASQMGKGQAAAQGMQAPVVPDTANCNGFSVWPCSVAWGACLPSGDGFCQNTQQWGCQIYSANTCAVTCAGYTCAANCYSVVCPPPPTGAVGPRITQCCPVATATLCVKK